MFPGDPSFFGRTSHRRSGRPGLAGDAIDGRPFFGRMGGIRSFLQAILTASDSRFETSGRPGAARNPPRRPHSGPREGSVTCYCWIYGKQDRPSGSGTSVRQGSEFAASCHSGSHFSLRQIRGSRRRGEPVRRDTLRDDLFVASVGEVCRATADRTGTKISRGDSEGVSFEGQSRPAYVPGGREICIGF